MSKGSAVVCAILLVLSQGAPAVAAPTMAPMTPRPDRGRPTVIHVGAYVINVSNLDEQSQAFAGDFYLWFTWLDPRLADPHAKGGRTVPLDQIWHPRLLPVNRRQSELLYPQIAAVDPRGEVTVTQRLVGTFTVPLKLEDFPFDEQTFYLEIVTPGLSPREITFVTDPARVGAEESMAIAGWHVGSPTLAAFTKRVLSDRDAVLLSGLRISMAAARDWHYYVLREILPMLFIVLMASSLFWIPPDEHGLKIGIATAAIFSLMAYYVQLGRSMPKLDYLTRMDWFIVGSTVLVFLSFGQVIAGMYLANREKIARVQMLERWARFVYPEMLLAILVLAFGR